ncbi:MAG: cyclic nucleotide-binding domain-containing protein [Chloroflexota bacterium]
MAEIDVIQGSPVFENLSPEQLQRIASISKVETYEAGRSIFREGDEARNLFVLQDGKVILEMKIAHPEERRPAPQATVDVIVRGEVFGWSTLIGSHVFAFSARAVDGCAVITIDGRQLLTLMESDLAMGYELMKRLSEVIASRLTHTRQTLISERGLALLSQSYSY